MSSKQTAKSAKPHAPDLGQVGTIKSFSEQRVGFNVTSVLPAQEGAPSLKARCGLPGDMFAKWRYLWGWPHVFLTYPSKEFFCSFHIVLN